MKKNGSGAFVIKPLATLCCGAHMLINIWVCISGWRLSLLLRSESLRLFLVSFEVFLVLRLPLILEIILTFDVIFIFEFTFVSKLPQPQVANNTTSTKNVIGFVTKMGLFWPEWSGHTGFPFQVSSWGGQGRLQKKKKNSGIFH